MGFTVSTRFDPPFKPGVYLAEVGAAKEKRSSRTGDGMIEVKFVAVAHSKKALCEDYIMVEGRARGLGIGKLRALGLDVSGKEFYVDAGMLLGKRVWLNVIEEQFEGRDGPGVRLKVARIDRGDIGYFREDSPPPGVDAPRPGEPVTDPLDDTPF